jgi:hypothetical protein
VIYRYLDCGDLHNGFARVRCGGCGHEYLLAFSCKRRHFCPSCHQKRVMEFGEWLCGDVVKAVPHRHVVFSIPKILRRCFLYDHERLTDLSRCGWESLKIYFTSCSKHVDEVPGAVIAIQTFGDLLGYNPHLHVLISDGCFRESGTLTVAPAIDTQALEQLFRHKILKLLLSEGRITEATVALMAKWRHSGFSVHCGSHILPQQTTAMENLARYIIRASFSQERLDYDAPSATVVYISKDGSRQKRFDAPVSSTGQVMEWLAAMCSHVPNKGEQMVRYYGYYSNVSRGKRQKSSDDGSVAYILEPLMPEKAFRKNWARLIQKIYEVDPQTGENGSERTDFRCWQPLKVVILA